jgi:prevent-host-death family protein
VEEGLRLGQALGLDLVYTLVQHLDMAEVNVHEAKTHLSRLLLRVAGGEEIVIARAGKPVARLVPIEPKPQRVIGQDDGLFEVPDDFDAPLPDEVLALFQS